MNTLSTLDAQSSVLTLSAGALAHQIAMGQISSQAVVEAHIQRLIAINPSLNAITTPLYDQARQAAVAADAAWQQGERWGPLHGVPVTLKESFALAGTSTTMGIVGRARQMTSHTCPLVQRLQAAGAIVLAKTNVPQLLLLNETDNPLYGHTNNPWRLTHSPGGSSGGEAAVIAAAGSPLGLGSDVGGSIRMPAHACGIHGLKPTAGRLPLSGHASLTLGQEAIVPQAGPMARSVADLKLAWNILAAPGFTGADGTIPPVPLRDADAVSIPGLRVAFYTDNGVIRSSPAVRRAVEEAAAALAERGAVVEAWTPPELPHAWSLFAGLLMADGMAAARRHLAHEPRDWRINQMLQVSRLPRRIMPPLAEICRALGQHHFAKAIANIGHRSVDSYWQLIEARTHYRQMFLEAMQTRQIEVLLCPPVPFAALSHGSSYDLVQGASYCSLFNLLGLPAGVVAATRVRPGEESDRPPSRDRTERQAREVELQTTGLPVGVQVAALHWREDVVLAVMAALEDHFRHQSDYPDLDFVPPQPQRADAG